MSERPLSRQLPCRYCEHDEHVFTRCGSEFGDSGVLCPCPPHHPNGIYAKEPTWPSDA